MPEILTRRFGPICFDEGSVLHFPAGLPGFETRTRFLLVERSANAPVVFLQNIDSPDLCFFAVQVAAIDPNYQLAITEEDQRLLASQGQTLCLAILSSTKAGGWTANLLAPVVIDLRSRRAVQAVRADSRYSHQHPIGGPRCS